MAEQRVVDIIKSVGAASQEVLSKNPARRYALLVNDSINIIYLMLGHDAALNRGIRINSGGGSYEINLTNPWPGSIFAFASGATSNLTIVEVSNAS